MPSAEPQLAIPGVFDAPRTLPIRAFIDPGHLARRWGRSANTFPSRRIPLGELHRYIRERLERERCK